MTYDFRLQELPAGEIPMALWLAAQELTKENKQRKADNEKLSKIVEELRIRVEELEKRK